jgi:hypothetical protein
VTRNLQSPVRKFGIDLDGDGKVTEVRMAMNYQALATLCDLWEVEADKLDAILNKLDVKKIPDVIYAAMSAVDETKTEADAKRVCAAVQITDLASIVGDLIGASQPQVDGSNAAKGPQKPPKRSR